MPVYSVQLDREHATDPTVCWRVWVWDLVAGGAISEESGQHYLYVPPLDAWMPDTLRLVLYELSVYIPGHEAEDALVRIVATLKGRRGRAPKPPNIARPRFNDDVRLAVEARGWRAEVQTNRDDRQLKPMETAPHPGCFTEPMQAWLLDLAAQSPFALTRIRPEYSAPGCDRDQMPSRLNIQDGAEAPWDSESKEWRDDLADAATRLREAVNRLNDGGFDRKVFEK